MNKPGIYRILTYWHPVATIGTIFFITYVPIQIFRAIFEGMAYQVAYSALLGYPSIVLALLVPTTMFREDRVTKIPKWLQDGYVHLEIYLGALLLCLAFCTIAGNSRSHQLGDRWNDLVVSPIFLYLCVLAPVMWNKKNGDKWERWVFWVLVLSLPVFFVIDLLLKTLNQRWWLVNVGLHAIERMR